MNLNLKYDGIFTQEYLLFETTYRTPDPPNLNTVWNYNMPTSKQMWQRTELPDYWKPAYIRQVAQEKYRTGKDVNMNWWMTNPTDEMRLFAQSEFEKRYNGQWLFINGILTYITGLNQYYLNWYQLDDGYPDYRDSDRRFWYVWDAVENDPTSMGLLMEKKRREGASFKGGCILLNHATTWDNVQCGLQNKVGKDALKAFTKIVVNPYKRMPFFYKPLTSGTDNPKAGLFFTNPSRRITLSQSFMIQNEDALDSSITFMPTVANAYDGEKLGRVMIDEGAKMIEANLLEMWGTQKKCLTMRGSQTGKAFLPSTILEDDELDTQEEAIHNFKTLFEESDPTKRLKDGKTVSGLTRYFSPANDGLHYENQLFFDKYGNSKAEEALEFLTELRADLKKRGHVRILRQVTRQFPLTWEEPFMPSAGASALDHDKLIQILDYLETKTETNRPRWMEMTVQGDLQWASGIGSDVRFIPNPKDGKFSFNMTVLNRYKTNWVRRESGGVYSPMNEDKFEIGVDPIESDLDDLTSGTFSMAAALAYWLPDMKIDGDKPGPDSEDFNADDWESNSIFVEYYARPPKGEMFFNDMMMLCHFLGCKASIERQKDGIYKFFRRHGYGKFLSFQAIKQQNPNQKGTMTVGNYASEAMHRNGFELWQRFVYDWGTPKHCPFPRTIRQLIAFNYKNITKLDLYAAGEQMFLGSERFNRPKSEKVLPVFEVKRYAIQNG